VLGNRLSCGSVGASTPSSALGALGVAAGDSGLTLKIAKTSQRLVGCGRAVQRGVAGVGQADVGNPFRSGAGCHLLLMLFLTTER
jgi:hypothetical protein